VKKPIKKKSGQPKLDKTLRKRILSYEQGILGTKLRINLVFLGANIFSLRKLSIRDKGNIETTFSNLIL
jgi:hypothetical protein